MFRLHNIAGGAHGDAGHGTRQVLWKGAYQPERAVGPGRRVLSPLVRAWHPCAETCVDPCAETLGGLAAPTCKADAAPLPSIHAHKQQARVFCHTRVHAPPVCLCADGSCQFRAIVQGVQYATSGGRNVGRIGVDKTRAGSNLTGDVGHSGADKTHAECIL